MRLIPQPAETEVFSAVSECCFITDFVQTDTFLSEEYELIIENNRIIAKASDEKGFFYAKTTFEQIKLLCSDIPCLRIKDFPRYSYRGFMIDCARHMFSIEELKKLIDVAASFKFNKFHWHLSDDQGFRIELDSLPELTEKGSVRDCDSFINCKSTYPYCGYYKKSEIKEIVSFCKERYIDVIPELDMPGHQSAFLHVYPQFTCNGENVQVKTKQGIFKDIVCAANTEAKETLKTILNEICELFPYDTIHIGGDEVPKSNWRSCEKCRKIMKNKGLSDYNDLQCLFINEMAEYLKNKGKNCIVWNDCLKGRNLSADITVQHWQKRSFATATEANKGRKIILSPFSGYYVDYPYGMHPLSMTYNFEPDKFSSLNDTGKNNILGVESPVWTEHINNNDRLEYMCFPRWFAVAETAWSIKENKNYAEFLSVCSRLCDKLRQNRINIPFDKEWNPPAIKRLSETLNFFIPKK